MKESKTTYSYLIEHMQEPSFQKVWDIAFDFVRKLPGDLCDELHESLNRGVYILDSEPLLQMYIYAFGKMHCAKLQYAFEHLHKNALLYNEIEIVDYGCGQGLATICYHDFLLEHNIKQKVKRITLLEPSSMALSRAELLCSKFYPDAEIMAVNKPFDELTNDDLILSNNIPTVHLFSNILDVESYDLNHFTQIIKEQSTRDNEYIIVSPLSSAQRVQRLKKFVSSIQKNTYFEHYLDKRQLHSEKDWTCAVLLCSQGNIIEYNCDEVFEEANSFHKQYGKDLDDGYRKELFHKLQVCAKYGDKRCQNVLGIWYQKGIGMEIDYILAFKWYKKSSEQGYASASCNLGNLYQKGNGVEKDLKKAFELFSIGANSEHPGCLFKLGLFFLNGEGVEIDKKKAFKLFTKASNLGSVPAKFKLFCCYYNGLGTEKDEKAALKYLKEAVKLKHPHSIYTLAIGYKNGELVEKNERKAFKLFRQSAKLGFSPAQVILGQIYKDGLWGMEKSPKKSFKWYLCAAEQGNDEAQFYVGNCYLNAYGVNKNDKLAFKWYERAAKQNNSAALNNLADCYQYGKGTSIDLTKAVYYYEKAAKLGDNTAQKNLAICYKNGKGVNIDTQMVFYWTLEAAKNSDLESQINIALYYLKGYGTEKSYEDSLIWYARYYHKICIENANQAYNSFLEKAKENDAQSLYLVGKCLQYGITVNKNLAAANSFFVKAADLGHVESQIKLRRQFSELRILIDYKSSIKDSYGVIYSKDKKILINIENLKTKEYKIADGTRIICGNAFYNSSIDNIVIPRSIVKIGINPFANLGGFGNGIKNIECYSDNFIVYGSALYTHDKKKLITYFGRDSKFIIPDGVETIGGDAFYDNEYLKEIIFPDSLLSIEKGAFMFCVKLESISLPDNTISLGAKSFFGCETLSNVLSLGRITIIKEDTFKGCDISNLTLPTTLIEIEDNAFNSNNNLKDVKLPDYLKKLGNSCFAFCAISSIILNDNLQEIGDFCFFKCPIDKITIPPRVKRLGKNPFIGTKHYICSDNDKYVSDNGLLFDKEHGDVIAHYGDAEIVLYPPICRIKSFAFCNSNVTDIFMGTNVHEVESWAFFHAEKLEKVIWQKCKVKIIPEGCFGNCISLHKIIIPESVEKVLKGSFFDCFDLEKIHIKGKETQANENIFERIKTPSDLPLEYWPHWEDSAFINCLRDPEIRNVDINTFPKIEIIVPQGDSKKFAFSAIYDHDRFNEHSTYGYGMDRDFIINENEEK